MNREIKKKKISVRDYVKRSLFSSIIFYVFLLIWQICIYNSNKKQQTVSSILNLLPVLFTIITWFFCYFEIRTITCKNERFLGYKGYIIFFMKLILIPIAIITTMLITSWLDNIFFVILINCFFVTLYYFIFILLLAPYSSMIRDNVGVIYICYGIRVKKWNNEGDVVNILSDR